MNKEEAIQESASFVPKQAELDAIINAPEKPKRTAEQAFLDMWFGCTLHFDEEYPQAVFLMKDGKVMFAQDFKNEYLWCNYDLVWLIFRDEFGMVKYQQWQSFTSKLVEERFKLKGLTPQLKQKWHN